MMKIVVAWLLQRAGDISFCAQKHRILRPVACYLDLHRAPLTNQGTHDPVVDRYRLSRLVHRINAIGTLRLSASETLQLRRADDELWQIETDIEIAAHDEAPRSRACRLGKV